MSGGGWRLEHDNKTKNVKVSGHTDTITVFKLRERWPIYSVFAFSDCEACGHLVFKNTFCLWSSSAWTNCYSHF